VVWLLLLIFAAPTSFCQGKGLVMTTEQEMLKLSRQKWNWMADKNVDALSALFDDQAMFVHMGATMPKTQELDVIKSGMIEYKRQTLKKNR
jgi:hypothetical protein